ncbi:MAG TPA: hypothetical protein VNV85_05250 [Puia sp.]|jgi:hypothetical protein|nr:hypothetical protein [Puia sp.]
MNEIVFETLVEQLEKINKSIQALTTRIEAIPDYGEGYNQMQEQQRMIQTQIKSISEEISIPVNEITELKQEVLKLIAQLKEPLLQKVMHIHYLSKPLLASIVLVMIILGLGVWLSSEMDVVSTMKENDIKYRMLNLSSDNNLTRALYKADSMFLYDPDTMRKEVDAAEFRRMEMMRKSERFSPKLPQKQKAKSNKAMN